MDYFGLDKKAWPSLEKKTYGSILGIFSYAKENVQRKKIQS